MRTVEQNNPAATPLLPGAHLEIFRYLPTGRIFVKKTTKNPWKNCEKIRQKLTYFCIDLFFNYSSFFHPFVRLFSPLSPSSERKGRHVVYLLNIKSENINSRKCRSRFRSLCWSETFRIVKCGTRGLSPGNLWRRFEQNEERNEPLFLPERGIPVTRGWKEDDRGEGGGDDVVNAERSRGCNNAAGFFVDSPALRIRARTREG